MTVNEFDSRTTNAGCCLRGPFVAVPSSCVSSANCCEQCFDGAIETHSFCVVDIDSPIVDVESKRIETVDSNNRRLNNNSNDNKYHFIIVFFFFVVVVVGATTSKEIDFKESLCILWQVVAKEGRQRQRQRQRQR